MSIRRTITFSSVVVVVVVFVVVVVVVFFVVVVVVFVVVVVVVNDDDHRHTLKHSLSITGATMDPLGLGIEEVFQRIADCLHSLQQHHSWAVCIVESLEMVVIHKSTSAVDEQVLRSLASNQLEENESMAINFMQRWEECRSKYVKAKLQSRKKKLSRSRLKVKAKRSKKQQQQQQQQQLPELKIKIEPLTFPSALTAECGAISLFDDSDLRSEEAVERTKNLLKEEIDTHPTGQCSSGVAAYKVKLKAEPEVDPAYSSSAFGACDDTAASVGRPAAILTKAVVLSYKTQQQQQQQQRRKRACRKESFDSELFADDDENDSNDDDFDVDDFIIDDALGGDDDDDHEQIEDSVEAPSAKRVSKENQPSNERLESPPPPRKDQEQKKEKHEDPDKGPKKKKGGRPKKRRQKKQKDVNFAEDDVEASMVKRNTKERPPPRERFDPPPTKYKQTKKKPTKKPEDPDEISLPRSPSSTTLKKKGGRPLKYKELEDVFPNADGMHECPKCDRAFFFKG